MKVLFIKNIPSPYRNELFNQMNEVFVDNETELEVWYLAKTEPNRKWVLKEEDFKYKHRYFWGIHPKVSNMFAHFNPGVYWKLLFTKADVVIIGGFGAPTLWFIPLFVKSKIKLALWVETNNNRSLRNTGIAHKFKSWLISRYKYFVVPGQRAKEYIEGRHHTADRISFISLPNLINERVYGSGVAELREKGLDVLKNKYGVSPDKQIWFCPARLSPEKGLLEFLSCIPDGATNFEFVIAGEGPLEIGIKELATKKNLPVKLVGNRQIDEIMELFSIADLFVLPSLADASPLSVIEALAARVPVFASDRIGNFPEVFNGKNGWSLSPDTPEQTQKLINEILSTSIVELKLKGVESGKLYLSNFDTKEKVKAFSDQMNSLKLSVK